MNLAALRTIPWWGWLIAAVGAGGLVYVFWKWHSSSSGATLGQSSSPGTSLPAELDPLTGVPYQVEEAINPATGLPNYYNQSPPPPSSPPPPTPDATGQSGTPSEWMGFSVQPGPPAVDPGGAPFSWTNPTPVTPTPLQRNPDSGFSVQPGTHPFMGPPPTPSGIGAGNIHLAGPGAAGGRVVTAGVWPTPQTNLAALHAQYGGGMPLSQWSQQVQHLNPGLNPEALYPRERVVIP